MLIPSLLVVAHRHWLSVPTVNLLIFFEKEGKSMQVTSVDSHLSVLVDLCEAGDVDEPIINVRGKDVPALQGSYCRSINRQYR